MDYIVYMYSSPSKKHYIGITNNESRRKSAHKRKAEVGDANTAFHRAILKYGFNNFEYEILHSNLTLCQAKELEVFEIQNRNTHVLSKPCCGYNMTIGGEGSNGFKHSKESKIKMSEAKMGFLVSEETKRTISKTMIEKNNILKYEKTPTTRGNFKQICNNRGLDFDDFIEVKSSLAVSGKIKYYYINKERTND